MRTCWIGFAALVTVGAASGAEITATIVSTGPGNPFAAKIIAQSLLKAAGIKLDWREPACLRIQLSELTPEDLRPGALGVSYPYSGCSKPITIYMDRVRARARTSAHEPVLLGYVIAHEVTHVIQSVDRHSATGIMKANWSIRDYDSIYKKRLQFEPEDLLLIRHGLASRSNQEALAIRSDREHVPPKRIRSGYSEQTLWSSQPNF